MRTEKDTIFVLLWSNLIAGMLFNLRVINSNVGKFNLILTYIRICHLFYTKIPNCCLIFGNRYVFITFMTTHNHANFLCILKLLTTPNLSIHPFDFIKISLMLKWYKNNMKLPPFAHWLMLPCEKQIIPYLHYLSEMACPIWRFIRQMESWLQWDLVPYQVIEIDWEAAVCRG